MKNEFHEILLRWPTRIIRDVDLAPLLPGSEHARHGLVKRAVHAVTLVRLMKGVYLIAEPYTRLPLNRFQVVHSLEDICYLSFESALAYHQLIPEAVYVTSCATVNRTREVHSAVGDFLFQHVPIKNFFLGVQRVEDNKSVYLVATPWRALADHYFIFQRPWLTPQSVFEDLRIEEEDLRIFSLESLSNLARHYPSPRVRRFLKQLLCYLEKKHDQRNHPVPTI